VRTCILVTLVQISPGVVTDRLRSTEQKPETTSLNLAVTSYHKILCKFKTYYSIKEREQWCFIFMFKALYFPNTFFHTFFL